jgi:hypothetical protein
MNCSRPAARRALAVMSVAGSIFAAGCGLTIDARGSSPNLAIPSAPGYSTFGGEHGLPLAVGRPWGQPCKPIRFAAARNVPDWVYAQLADTVGQARRDGLDVTMESRRFYWHPNKLYYLGDESPKTTVLVGIYAKYKVRPRPANGTLGHSGIGWDTRVDHDLSHEDITTIYGVLVMQRIVAKTVRAAARRLIAMTQGVGGTTRPDSAITRASIDNNFTPGDINAMKRASGCD